MITARSYFWHTLTQQPTLSTHHRSTIYQPTLVNDREVLRKYRNWEEEQVALPRHDPNRNANMLVLGLSKALTGWSIDHTIKHPMSTPYVNTLYQDNVTHPMSRHPISIHHVNILVLLLSKALAGWSLSLIYLNFTRSLFRF